MGKQADQSDTNGAAKDAVASTSKAAQDKANDVVASVSATANKQADVAKARGEAALDSAKTAGTQMTDKTMAATESGLRQMSEQADMLANRLRDQSAGLPGPAAEAAHYAASGIERGSAYLNQADVRGFVDYSQDLVKDNRKVMAGIGIAVALVLLLVIVRALRGSSDD